MEWFPALRKRLAARGVHLPDPYPYTARTFKGSVLATLLAAILFLIAHAVWEAASYTARSVQRTAFITIETTAATSRLVTEKAGQAVEAPTSLESNPQETNKSFIFSVICSI